MSSHPEKLSRMTEDYLKVIYSAEEWGSDGMSVSELADRVGVVASTASENVRRLTDLGLVAHEPYQAVRLTAEGRSQAVAMVRRHRLLETYLYERLDYDWDEVHAEAEILEHAVSDRLLEHLDRALGYPNRDPHGDPIPAADGTLVAPPMVTIDRLEVGESGAIARISDDSSAMLRGLEGAGLVLDARVRVVERLDGLDLTRVEVTPAPVVRGGTAGDAAVGVAVGAAGDAPGAVGGVAASDSDAPEPGPDPAPEPFMMDLAPVATASIYVAVGEDTVSEPR